MEFHNVTYNETIFQRAVLIYGRVSSAALADATVLVHSDGFPTLEFPCVDGFFKALCILQPGLNNLRFQLQEQPDIVQHLALTYQKQSHLPPLHLAILVAKDSTFAIDTPHDKHRQTITDAIEKLRFNAYMWQAFTAEQMRRNGFGRRSFTIHEELIEETISQRLGGTPQETARVFVVPTKEPLSELRRWDLAQQKSGSSSGSDDSDDSEVSRPDLYSIFLDALRGYGAPFDKPCHVAGLILDSHWEPKKNAILAHAALGGSGGDISLGMFGSHLTHAWPSCFEDLIESLEDDTPNDPTATANDNGECQTSFKAFCIGSGAFLHEVGHSYTLTHTPSGIMSRGFNHFNRSFNSRDPYIGLRPITMHLEDGSHWHRLDCVRLRFHPDLRLPSDPELVISPESPSIQLSNDSLFIASESPIMLIEWYIEPDVADYEDLSDTLPLTYEIHNIEDKIRHLASSRRDPSRKIKVEVTAINQQHASISDLEGFLRDSIMVLDGKRFGKSVPVGEGKSFGTRDSDFTIWFDEDPLVRINVFADTYVNGIEFCFGSMRTVFAGHARGTKKTLNLPANATIQRIDVNSGWWIDGFQILFSNGFRSEWFGTAGARHSLVCPPNAVVAGIYGGAADNIDKLGIIYSL
ncbi:putative peptidase family-domain-containing protein [Polychytrium aggregatum]|uniref:putative peptidase family-domain-containing protein n=1 Tax=Polychytrium aggregatum TaxID=110093 RepID=UPI0022FDD35B|nr:putative peptidase family-domain-containing protein [Polychytrium aggregatum]KAI9208552.1 putative peptidase family-domain-containing protein [Polychytrium aggregatum]